MSNFCMESIPIENCEPCQVRKEAAISRTSLCGMLSIEKLGAKISYFFKIMYSWGDKIGIYGTI